MKNTLGIVGAGKLGIAFARTALASDFDVMITSRELENTRLIAEVMAPGTRVGTLSELTNHSDLIVLAVPLHSFHELPRDAFDGKVLIDAINYWEPVDGGMERFGVAAAATSQLIQAHFAKAKVVKSFNQLGYHDLEEGGRPGGATDRLGVAVAGNDEDSKTVVKGLVDSLGFDAVDAGTLAEGARLGPGGPAFGATLSAERLRVALGLVSG